MSFAPDPDHEFQKFYKLFALIGLALWGWVLLKALVH